MKPPQTEGAETRLGVGSACLWAAVSLSLGMPLLAQAEATDRWLIRLTPISAEAEEQCAPTGFLKALPLEEGVTPHRIPARLGQAVSTDLQATEEWTLSIDIPGCWAPDTPLEPLDAPAMRDIHLWPTGSVTGRLAVARHEEVPATLRVRVTPAPSETDAEDADVGHVVVSAGVDAARDVERQRTHSTSGSQRRASSPSTAGMWWSRRRKRAIWGRYRWSEAPLWQVGWRSRRLYVSGLASKSFPRR